MLDNISKKLKILKKYEDSEKVCSQEYSIRRDKIKKQSEIENNRII